MTETKNERWKPGDRVVIDLSRHRRNEAHLLAVPGTVVAVDPPGLPAGVRIDLDFEVHGCRDCYATHSELRRETTP